MKLNTWLIFVSLSTTLSSVVTKDGRANLPESRGLIDHTEGTLLVRRQQQASPNAAANDKPPAGGEADKAKNTASQPDGGKAKPEGKPSSDDTTDAQDQEEEEGDDGKDDGRGNNNGADNFIRFEEPVYGSLRILNIPLGGEQKIRWKLPSDTGKTKAISVTAALPTSGGNSLIYPIARNLKLSKTSVTWNTSDFIHGQNDTQPLRASPNYRLFVHDAALNHDQVNRSRVRFAALQFNLYSPPDVSNQFGINGGATVIPHPHWLVRTTILLLIALLAL